MFWDNFLALCIASGKSPNGVAKELSIPSGSITAWKNGSIPRSPTLIKIATYFNIEISALTKETNQKEKSPAPEGVELDKDTLELLEIWRTGDVSDREFLLANARMLKARRK